jgi:hypothetical protein
MCSIVVAPRLRRFSNGYATSCSKGGLETVVSCTMLLRLVSFIHWTCILGADGSICLPRQTFAGSASTWKYFPSAYLISLAMPHSITFMASLIVLGFEYADQWSTKPPHTALTNIFTTYVFKALRFQMVQTLATGSVVCVQGHCLTVCVLPRYDCSVLWPFRRKCAGLRRPG